MSWLSDHWIVLTLLFVYVALMARHAWYGRTHTHGIADYYIGGRKMGGLALGISFFATYSSTNSFVGYAGQGYLYGAPWLLVAPAVVIFSLAAWIWVAPRLRVFTEAFGSLTIPDFFGYRYNSNAVRLSAALIVILSSFLYVTAIFKGVAHTFEAFLDLPYWLAIGLVFVIVVSYTTVGGFISVVKTDVIQGMMLIVAAIVLFAGTVRTAGGLTTIAALREAPDTAHLFTWDAAMPLPLLLGIIFGTSIKFLVEPRQLSRFYALKDRQAVRSGLWCSTLSFLVVYTLLVPVGLYARTIFGDRLPETDRVVPALLTDPSIFPTALSALILIALLAAAMSSLDSVLLVMASTCERDVVRLCRGETSEGNAIRQTRIYVVLLALISALIALNPPGSIVPMTAFSGNLYGACFFPVMIFGLYWKRGSSQAALFAFLAGLVTLLGWRPLQIWPSMHEVFPAMLLSTMIFVVVSWLRRSEPPKMVQELLNQGGY